MQHQLQENLRQITCFSSFFYFHFKLCDLQPKDAVLHFAHSLKSTENVESFRMAAMDRFIYFTKYD